MIRNGSDVILLPFPHDDDAFVRRAQILLDSLESGLDRNPRRLEASLRVEYPDAVVRRRDGLGALDPSTEAWYVYRDGRATTSKPDRAEAPR